MSPRPRTAEPSETTATTRGAQVKRRASSGSAAMALDTRATPGRVGQREVGDRVDRAGRRHRELAALVHRERRVVGEAVGAVLSVLGAGSWSRQRNPGSAPSSRPGRGHSRATTRPTTTAAPNARLSSVTKRVVPLHPVPAGDRAADPLDHQEVRPRGEPRQDDVPGPHRVGEAAPGGPAAGRRDADGRRHRGPGDPRHRPGAVASGATGPGAVSSRCRCRSPRVGSQTTESHDIRRHLHASHPHVLHRGGHRALRPPLRRVRPGPGPHRGESPSRPSRRSTRATRTRSSAPARS